MRHTRALAIFSLGLVAALIPTAASARGVAVADDEGSEGSAIVEATDDVPDLSAVYLYKVIDPAAEVEWKNSGPQTLLSITEGHAWLEGLELADLPEDVCGPGWAVQEDWITGLTEAEVPVEVDFETKVGWLKWWNLVDSTHTALEELLGEGVAVPACPVEPTPTPTPTETTEPPTETVEETVVVLDEVVTAPPAVAVLASPTFTG